VLVVGHDTQISPQVAAEWLGVSRPFVYRLIERGDLRADRVGAHYRLRARDVLDLADRRAQLASSVDQGFATALESHIPGQAQDPDPKSAWQAMDATSQAAALERVRMRAAGRYIE
jgi:excisionase family DNA binding protein